MRQQYILGVAFVLGATACGMSTQQEVALGTQYSGEIAKQLPLVNNSQITGYLNSLGQSLAQVADTRGLQWRFHLVNSKEVNAFAVPGGFIYVNRGLVERARNMAQLAGVLGHEIGHVTLRHSVQQMQKAQGANMTAVLLCTLTNACSSSAAQAAINVGGGALFAKFSRDDEREADREGVKTAIRAGIDPNGIPEMFEILLAERRARPDAVSAIFASHPLEEDRVQGSRDLIATYQPNVVRGLRKDDAAFQAFKQRVLALPAPPAK
jgi:predicted Zn-dependent protease